MTGRKKLTLLLSIAIAVLAIVLLAAGIADLELARSTFRSIAPEEGGPDAVQSIEDIFDEPVSAANVIFSFVLLVALLISIVHFILSPEARRRVIQRFLRLFFIIFAIYVISTRLGRRLNPEQEAPEGGDRGEFLILPAEEIAANLPPWVSFAVSLTLAALVILVGWLLWRRSQRKPDALELLTGEAQAALQELRSGADFKNTIIHCYYQMCAIMDRERGIHRQENMTAREFEEHLTQLGLPVEPVTQLTRLFEKARYSSNTPDHQDERAAWDCLSAIAEVDGSAR
jgi:hypothetical protein